MALTLECCRSPSCTVQTHIPLRFVLRLTLHCRDRECVETRQLAFTRCITFSHSDPRLSFSWPSKLQPPLGGELLLDKEWGGGVSQPSTKFIFHKLREQGLLNPLTASSSTTVFTLTQTKQCHSKQARLTSFQYMTIAIRKQIRKQIQGKTVSLPIQKQRTF